MAGPENPADDQTDHKVATDLAKSGERAAPVFFTLLIYIVVLIAGVLIALSLVDSPAERANESAPAEESAVPETTGVLPVSLRSVC